MHITLSKENRLAIVVGIICLLLYLSLAIGSRDYGDLGLSHLLVVCVLCALMSFCLWYYLQTSGGQTTGEQTSEQQIDLRVLLGFALLFRIVGGLTFPILEDDFYRYLWDGHMTWTTGSPYGLAPAAAFADESITERFQLILDSINYPDVATIYGPSCQWLFALSYVIAPGEVWPLKVMLGLIDLALIVVLLKMAKPNSVMLYAWSPLVIKEFVITAHPDVLGVLFLVLALYMHQRRSMLAVGICVALAAGVKLFAVLLLPFLLQFYWRAWLGFALTAVFIALPFGLVQAWLPEGLSAMGSAWLFNAPLYLLLGQIFEINHIKLMLLFGLAFVCAFHYWQIVVKPTFFNSSVSPSSAAPLHKSLRGDLLYAALLLCSPVMNAWYLVWLLPFVVLRPSLWAWLASITVLLSYASGINLSGSSLEPYEHSPWVLALEYLPLLLVLIATPKLKKLYAKRTD